MIRQLRWPGHRAADRHDIESDDAAVLAGGSLPVAMRASVSLPGVFRPASVNGRLLVDGGIAEAGVHDQPGRELLRNTARMMSDRSRVIGDTRQALGDRPLAKKRLADLERFYRAISRGIEKALVELGGSQPAAAARPAAAA